MHHRASAFFIASRLQDELRRLLHDAVELAPGTGLETMEPRLDVLEMGERLLVLVDVPGVSAGALHVEVEGQGLRIRVDKPARRPNAGETHYHCVECSRGPFERQLRLPSGFDLDGLHAHLESGVLRIEAPRAATSRRGPRTVPITEVEEEERSRD